MEKIANYTLLSLLNQGSLYKCYLTSKEGTEQHKRAEEDLAATDEIRIHSAGMKGTCIYAGFLPDFGNYAVIKYDNGTYMRVGHLSTSTRHLQGKVIPAGMYLGNAGSTGFSTGTHLHVDFWNKNRQLINVESFQRQMR